MDSVQKSQSPPFPNEQRYFPRWETSNKVVLQCEHDFLCFDGSLLDLSCTGVSLQSESILCRNQILKLKVFLTDQTSVDVKGEIVWVKALKKGYQAGVLFFSIGPAEQDLILEHAFEINREVLVKHWFNGWEGKNPQS